MRYWTAILMLLLAHALPGSEPICTGEDSDSATTDSLFDPGGASATHDTDDGSRFSVGTPAIGSWTDGDGSLRESTVFQRTQLTGRWWGARDALEERGVTLDVSATEFYQGVTAGGIEQEFAFAGRNDYLLKWDAEKAGLWNGLYINLHGETRFGNDINDASGAFLAPPNIAMLFPLPSGTVTALTAAKASQYVTESLVVYAGKFNMLDELVQPFGAGRGVDAFMNTGLVFPVVLDRTVPYSTLGAGMSVMQGDRAVFTLMVIDTHNTPTTSGFESLFTNGVTLLSKIDIPVTIGGLPGHQGVEATYSTGLYTSLATIPYIDAEGLPSLAFGTAQGSWSVFYAADQALYVDPANPARSWGVFTNIGLADQDPSPIRWSASFGLAGSSPWRARPLDRFGIGYSLAAPSAPLRSQFSPSLPLGTDHAVELFYN
ncbi:MAG: carbohydrate porin, partial [Planctomycetales bacterium]